MFRNDRFGIGSGSALLSPAGDQPRFENDDPFFHQAGWGLPFEVGLVAGSHFFAKMIERRLQNASEGRESDQGCRDEKHVVFFIPE